MDHRKNCATRITAAEIRFRDVERFVHSGTADGRRK